MWKIHSGLSVLKVKLIITLDRENIDRVETTSENVMHLGKSVFPSSFHVTTPRR